MKMSVHFARDSVSDTVVFLYHILAFPLGVSFLGQESAQIVLPGTVTPVLRSTAVRL